MKVTDKFVFFFTKDDIFSNHYRCENWFTLPKYRKLTAKFWTVEHLMMYEKAMLFRDGETASKIAKAYSPQQAKMLGREVKNFNNDLWEEYRERIVVNALVAKMLANDNIKDRALDYHLSGRRFVEASPYDAIWGIKMGENDPDVEDVAKWKGQNLLGHCWHKACCIYLEKLEVR